MVTEDRMAEAAVMPAVVLDATRCASRTPGLPGNQSPERSRCVATKRPHVDWDMGAPSSMVLDTSLRTTSVASSTPPAKQRPSRRGPGGELGGRSRNKPASPNFMSATASTTHRMAVRVMIE